MIQIGRNDLKICNQSFIGRYFSKSNGNFVSGILTQEDLDFKYV